jgi:hypothetical protein
MVQFPLVRWSVIVCSCDDIGTQTWAVRATQLVDTSPNTSGGPWQQQNQGPGQKPGQQQGGGSKPGQQSQAPGKDKRNPKEQFDQTSDTDT